VSSSHLGERRASQPGRLARQGRPPIPHRYLGHRSPPAPARPWQGGPAVTNGCSSPGGSDHIVSHQVSAGPGSPEVRLARAERRPVPKCL